MIPYYLSVVYLIYVIMRRWKVRGRGGEGRGGGGGSPVAGGSWFARRPNKKATNLYNGRMKANDEQGVSDEKGIREGGGQYPG